MSDDNTQGAAEPSGADAGSQPAAYEIHWKRQDGTYMANPYLVFANEQPSQHWRPSPRCVPLYRQPQPAITDEEREAIAWFASYTDTPGEERHAAVLAKLIARCRVDCDR